MSYAGHRAGTICSGVQSPARTRPLSVLAVITCCGSALCSGVFSYAQARSSSFLRSYKTSLCVIVGAARLHSTVRRSSVCTIETSAHSSCSINVWTNEV